MPTYLADQPSLDQTPGGFEVLALASEISGYLNRLNDTHINSITILDNGQVGLSVQQLTTDKTAIGLLVNANSSPVELAVNDTAADIENGLPTLADTGKVASISVSNNGRVAVSVSTFFAYQKTLDKIVGGFAISGTAANVAQNLDALNADTNVTSIALTDGGVPTLSISLAQASNDTRALDAITTPHMIVITGGGTITSTEAIYLSGENIGVDGAPVIATGTVATMAILCTDRNVAPRKPRLYPGGPRYGGEYPGADASPDQQPVGPRRASNRVRATRAWRCRRSSPNLSKPRI